MFSTSENWLVGISGVLKMKESHFLMQKCVLRNCWGISQIQWMLELSNICHCIQHLWKLTNRHFCSSRNERKPLSQLKMCFEKIMWIISDNSECQSFQTFAIVFSTPENLLMGISGAARKESKATLYAKICFVKMLRGITDTWWMQQLSNLCHCVQHSW